MYHFLDSYRQKNTILLVSSSALNAQELYKIEIILINQKEILSVNYQRKNL